MIATDKEYLEAVINRLEGWCTLSKAQRIYDLVIESDSQLGCELGTFGGRSLIPMALAYKQKGSGFIFGIDTWHKNASLEGTNSDANSEWWAKVDFKYIYNTLSDAIDHYELNDFCGTIRLNSKAMGLLVADNVLDIIHQDSNHSSEVIIQELELWAKKLKVGGYWIADDIHWPESKEGYSKLPEYGMELFEQYEQWAIYKKVR